MFTEPCPYVVSTEFRANGSAGPRVRSRSHTSVIGSFRNSDSHRPRVRREANVTWSLRLIKGRRVVDVAGADLGDRWRGGIIRARSIGRCPFAVLVPTALGSQRRLIPDGDLSGWQHLSMDVRLSTGGCGGKWEERKGRARKRQTAGATTPFCFPTFKYPHQTQTLKGAKQVKLLLPDPTVWKRGIW